MGLWGTEPSFYQWVLFTSERTVEKRQMPKDSGVRLSVQRWDLLQENRVINEQWMRCPHWGWNFFHLMWNQEEAKLGFVACSAAYLQSFSWPHLGRQKHNSKHGFYFFVCSYFFGIWFVSKAVLWVDLCCCCTNINGIGSKFSSAHWTEIVLFLTGWRKSFPVQQQHRAESFIRHLWAAVSLYLDSCLL